MKYVSMLRGINVSGQKKIKMSELKMLCENNGFEDVTTYIQSGNIIFKSKNNNKNTIKSKLEKSIIKQYGFDVPINIRSNEEIRNIFDNSPFIESLDEENSTKILVTFLSSI